MLTVKVGMVMLQVRKNNHIASKGERLNWTPVKDVKHVTVKSLNIKPIETKDKSGKRVAGASTTATLLIP